MLFSLACGVLVVFGIGALAIGVRILMREAWFRGWIRGTAGLILVGVALVLVALAVHLYPYNAGELDKSIATLSFKQVKPQKYEATLVVTETGIPRKYYLNGDQWQLDARIIRPKGLVGLFGNKLGYRLNKISGRFLTLDEDHTQERTIYSLRDQEFGVDLWAWLRKHKETPWLQAIYGKAAFLPMADGALFEVSLSESGLQAKPLNSAAFLAVNAAHL